MSSSPKKASPKKPSPKTHTVHDTPGFVAEPDFTGGIADSMPEEALEHRGFDWRVKKLVENWDCAGKEHLIAELIFTALNIGHDNADEGELKMLNRALKEMRRANNVFRPFRHRRKVAVFGSARTKLDAPEYEAAVEFSRKMSDHDFMTITGAGPGIMEAAQAGATAKNSFGLRIQLPFEAGANEVIQNDPKLVRFNYFFTRKLSFVKEANAVALFPGGFGTMDEGFEVMTLMQTGKAVLFPIVMVDAKGGSYWRTYLQFIKEHLFRLRLISEDDFHLFKVTDDVDEAVEEIVNFYRVFNSYRYVRDKLVIRLNHALAPKEVERLNVEFKDLLAKGAYVLGNALPEEKNEPSLASLPRLIGTLKRSNYGRLRQFIDAINSAETVS